MTCCMGEEDKLAREGSEKRRIMGLRRESLIFILLVGALLNGYRGREGGRGMIVRLLPYMHHTWRRNSPTHGHKDPH